MKETTGADFKSATDSENKKLFIETYGCQMNVACFFFLLKLTDAR